MNEVPDFTFLAGHEVTPIFRAPAVPRRCAVAADMPEEAEEVREDLELRKRLEAFTAEKGAETVRQEHGRRGSCEACVERFALISK